MSDHRQRGDLVLLLPDVAWHQNRIRWALAAGCFLLILAGPLLLGIVDAVRGTIADPGGEDPLGPLDVAVILGGVVCLATAFALFRSAAVHRRIAAVLVSWQAVDRCGRRVSERRLKRHIGSMVRLRRRLDREGERIVELSSVSDARRRWLLYLAARNMPGTRQERSERFGESVAVDYERAQRLRWTVAILSCLAVVCIGAIAMIGYMRDRFVSSPYLIGREVLAFAVILSPVAGAVLRRSRLGLRPLVQRVLPELRTRDPEIDENLALALLVKPRLYEVWRELHPLGAGERLSFAPRSVSPPRR
ncbi:hypothetical protein [Microbacterium sp. 22242]|uniref:hypothetical protein n=1 Tax=Microbacterium sp. 22242 TaxID=3453896 RepID=UPI003F875CD5